MQRRKDFYVVVGLVLGAIPIALYFQINFLTSTILFFGIPSAYLVLRRPRIFKKAAVAGGLLGIVLGFSFDFVAEFNAAWGWESDFALPVELFGLVSIDILIWYFFWVFLVVAFYEYFIEHDNSTRISAHAKWVLIGGIVLAATVVSTWKVAPQILVLDHAYATLGILTFAICTILLLKHTRLIPKVLRIVPFFVFMYLAYELTALHLNLWTFPGVYFGSVTVHTISFPLEELVVWILASSAVVATYYEFCIDDDR